MIECSLTFTAVAIIMSEKLQKVLARSGLGSRRAMEALIIEGKVSINGQLATIGDRVEAEDIVRVEGKKIKFSSEEESGRRVLAYHKPEGEVCTRTDPEGRPTVFEHLPKLHNERWVAVGRLDYNTSGLLLFTTDGTLANQLMHPSSQVEREYAVRVLGQVDADVIDRLTQGVLLDDGLAKFDSLRDSGGEGANHWYHVVLKEGRNREVRRLWESQGLTVSRLSRVRFGNIVLPRDLRVGRWKELPPEDMDGLASLVGCAKKSHTGLYGRGRDRSAKNTTKPRKGTGYLRRKSLN